MEVVDVNVSAQSTPTSPNQKSILKDGEKSSEMNSFCTGLGLPFGNDIN
jgi:hypothetical protein